MNRYLSDSAEYIDEFHEVNWPTTVVLYVHVTRRYVFIADQICSSKYEQWTITIPSHLPFTMQVLISNRWKVFWKAFSKEFSDPSSD